MSQAEKAYWNAVAESYHTATHILTTNFHYGPLIPGDRELGLLPADVCGSRCLEVGCGGAQNSICLAGRGARCVALDLAGQQCRRARELVVENGLEVEIVGASMEQLPLRTTVAFDLVHSAYALPFVRDPRQAIHEMARFLRPGGTLLLSTAHPLHAFEWLDVDDEEGVYVTDYFHPPAEERTLGDGARTVCRAFALSQVHGWLHEAGLVVDAFLEPEPLPIHTFSHEQIAAAVPYWSETWLEKYEELRRVPFVAIFRAVKDL